MKKKITWIMIYGVSLLIQPINAQTWTATKRLTWNWGSSQAPDAAVGSNNHIHVVWMDDTPGDGEIYYKKSTNVGNTWTAKRLTWNAGNSYYPAIAVDKNNHIHLVWNDYTPGNPEIYYKKSMNGGTSWTDKRLTWNTGNSTIPDIAVDSHDYVHIVWEDNSPGNFEVFYKISTDGGTNWATKRLTYNSSGSFYPSLAIDTNDHIHLVWYDDAPGNYEIFYNKSTDGGATWAVHKRLTWNSGDSIWPMIAVDSGNVIHMVWSDIASGNREIYYKKSTDGGATWTTKRLTYNSGWSGDPAIGLDSDSHIHVVWRDNDPGNDEIFYKKSTNGGTDWSAKRLSWTIEGSFRPRIALDYTNVIHVVWDDESPGNHEIYYRKGIQ